ncbi:hypothetical protein DAEQUDRAFT_691083 [Daedalea quercina L-15889]|uniref:RRM domain-containing protein n=1 Tax=Daedalea quercina L-15889 TaxID=1314783 RepID=A0A165QB81_9APHY|nr:hypothetical protein DAEQUDRAFT_691083 [Daedalea quercina L-15889]
MPDLMEEIITKRLHVSGFTPAITKDDLARRFGTFGTVKAMDGFGLVDAVGQPRKFGYVTLETTKKNLGRCLNLLSGVTWKGAQLRIGEAKPDFRERIAQEHEAMKRAASDTGDDRPKKRRRLARGVKGVHAADMSLVTPENAASRPGWRITALGRIIRPIRMRPDHPLPDPQDSGVTKAKGKIAQTAGGKKKKRVKPPLTRARRRTIDPTNWDSQHLKGMFLENVVVADVPKNVLTVMDREDTPGEIEGASSSESDESDDSDARSAKEYSDKTPRRTSPAPPALVLTVPTRAIYQDTTARDLREETHKSLGLLQALFGDKGADDWGDKESVGSTTEDDHRSPQDVAAVIEDVAVQELNEEVDEEDAEDDAMGTASDHPSPTVASQASAPVQVTKLKDLFAPREEDAGFSLLGHLDLDLELDEEVDLHLPSRTQSQPEPAVLPPSTALPSLPSFDPKAPLFFPLPPAERNRGRLHNVLDPTNWQTWFYRTDSEEDIRKRWEEVKGELTAGWKRRHREAVKSRRRRGGGPGDAEL